MSQSRLGQGSAAASWAVLATVAVTCMTACSGLGLRFTGLALPVLGTLMLAAAMLIGFRSNSPRLFAGAEAFLLMTLFTILGVILSYALAARGGPLWDGALLRADQQLGFDWPSFFAAADRSPLLVWIGGIAYHSLPVQMVVCIVALSGAGHVATLRSAVLAALLSGFVTILISGLMPAMGNVFDPDRYARLWPSVAWLERDMLTGLRNGAWRDADLSHLWGIVTFPSYHATLPIILAWAQREVPWLRIIAPVWAAATILATPLFGGHYGVDVLAGVAIAPAALGLASLRAWQRSEGGRSSSSTARPDQPRSRPSGAADAVA